MTALKPCPFCDGDRIRWENWDHPVGYYVCECMAMGPTSKDQDTKKWNTRPAEDELRAELEESKRAEEVAVSRYEKEVQGLRAANEAYLEALQKIAFDDLCYKMGCDCNATSAAKWASHILAGKAGRDE